MHDFRDSLAKSHAAEDLPLWREVYEKAFPFFQEMLNHRMDGEHQRAGVDRSIILYNSKQILIDENVRLGVQALALRLYRLCDRANWQVLSDARSSIADCMGEVWQQVDRGLPDMRRAQHNMDD